MRLAVKSPFFPPDTHSLLYTELIFIHMNSPTEFLSPSSGMYSKLAKALTISLQCGLFVILKPLVYLVPNSFLCYHSLKDPGCIALS